MLTGKMGMQLILPVIISFKKIKVASRQCYGDYDKVVRCEQILINHTPPHSHSFKTTGQERKLTRFARH